MPESNQQFKCGTPNCGYAIAIDGLNGIQLKALRLWKKTCPVCGKMTHWIETASLLNTETIKQPMEGKSNATNTSKVRTKSQSQKRKAARYSGH